jgi:leucyl-tRNA synthetase
VVTPDDMIARFGADAARMYTLFAAPPDRDLDWQEDGVAGVSRFLGKVYRFATRHAHTARSVSIANTSAPDPVSRALLRKLHQTIGKITGDFAGRWHFNTCIAAIMELVNTLTAAEDEISAGRVPAATVKVLLENLVLLLAPFAPYLAFELWEQLGHEQGILRTPWPKFDEALAREDEIEIPVQVNGKLRAVVRLLPDADAEAMKQAALAEGKVQASIAGKQIVKVVVVPGKLINIVVK